MYGYARARPGLKIDAQIEAIEAYAGRQDVRIFVERKSRDETWKDCLGALRPGNTLVVSRLVALVPPKTELNGKAPRKFLDEVIQALVEKKVQVIEAETGRDLNDADDAKLAVSNAYNELAGYKNQRAGPGRPKNKPLEDVERERLKGLWTSNRFATNEEAAAAMGGKWNPRKAYEAFGKSGRASGRPKIK